MHIRHNSKEEPNDHGMHVSGWTLETLGFLTHHATKISPDIYTLTGVKLARIACSRLYVVPYISIKADSVDSCFLWP